jgi:hypothetical protein
MRGIGLVGALAVLVLLPLGSSGRPLPLHGPQAATAPLAGILREPHGARLVHVDPRTFDVLRRSALVGSDGGWVRSPDGRVVAVATGGLGMTSTLRFADIGTLRWARKGVHLGGYLTTALWTSPTTIVAVVGGLIIERIDTVAKRIVSNDVLKGTVIASGRTPTGLVLLVVSEDALGPVTVLAVGPTGALRSTRLDRILGGVAWTDRNAYIGTRRYPALAVDPAGTAYVLDPDGLVAKIDLGSLSVEYHRLEASLLARVDAWIAPAAQAKAVDGPTRTAQWLGDGLIALGGSNGSTLKNPDGSLTLSFEPAGLRIVDTTDWSARMIDPRADSALVADGLLLATGGTWSYGSGAAAGTGIGVAAYGPDGTVRWRFDDGARRHLSAAYGPRAIVYGDGSGPNVVLDLETGRVARSFGGDSFPQLLLGAGS